MKSGKTLEQFEQKHGTGRVQELQATVDRLARQHRTVVLDVPSRKNSITFGLLGDSHYGSLYEAKDVTKALYRRFAADGITTVLHAGDVLDGHKLYRGQEFELHALGWAKQRDWFAQEAPREPGITTHFITGNHDGSLKKIAGIDVGAELEHVRPDWKCLGEDVGNVRLTPPNGKSFDVMLLHPSGGSAYAISYRPQKIVEQLEGGRKPNFLAVGNFHKAEFLPSYRNIAVCQVGCFDPLAMVTTKDGRVPISKIQIGDMVLTHTGHYRLVSHVNVRSYRGPWTTIVFGRKGANSVFRSTAEHPLLTSQDGQEWVWKNAQAVRTGDWVLIETNHCSSCNSIIPYFNKMCPRCNPMDHEDVRRIASLNRQGVYDKAPAERKVSKGEEHLLSEVLPFCLKMQSEGWQIIPTAGGVVPDAVGFKDGRIVLFEVERRHYIQLARKQKKYGRAHWLEEFPHVVQWIDAAPRVTRQQSEFMQHETGFVAVRVLESSTQQCERSRVWNLEVEVDNSYVCKHVVVHNCTQWQTPFMLTKGLAAHVGGWIIRVTPGEFNHAITAEFIAFYANPKGGR